MIAVILVTLGYNEGMNSAVVKKLDTFFSHYPVVIFNKGATIFDAMQQPSGIFYITEGIVRRYWISESGNEITLNLYKPHTFLPMSWAISDVPNIHTYEALTNVKTRKAPKKDVLLFLKEEPDIVYDLLKRVYVGMEGLWQHIEFIASGNSFVKLAASLLMLAKRFGERKNEGKIAITIHLGQQEIANYAGMSRETASREFQKLKEQGIASLQKGTVIVEDIKKLENLLTL